MKMEKKRNETKERKITILKETCLAAAADPVHLPVGTSSPRNLFAVAVAAELHTAVVVVVAEHAAAAAVAAADQPKRTATEDDVAAVVEHVVVADDSNDSKDDANDAVVVEHDDGRSVAAKQAPQMKPLHQR